MMAILSVVGLLGFLLVSEACVDTGFFNKKGFSLCPHNTQYIKSFHRIPATYKTGFLWRKVRKDPIDHLKTAKCCGPSDDYKNENSICQPADWWDDFDKAGSVRCPTGYFLNGLRRTGGSGLSNIETARCCRPWGHPLKYSDCYDQNINHGKTEIGCSRTDYFIVGLTRSGNNLLEGLTKFKCCKLAPHRPQPRSLDDVKQYLMDRTRLDLARLASDLGYKRTRGCGSEFVGDDFKRVGDSWEANTKGRLCGLFSHNKRLKIHYKNIKFVTAGKVKWGKRVRDVVPTKRIVDAGTVTNNDANPTKTVLDRTEESTRSVTHQVSKTWKKSHEVRVDLAGFLLGFTCGVAGGVGGRVGYTFKYEDSTTTTTTNHKSDTKKFRVHSEKEIPGYSQARWRILMTKTQTKSPYKANVMASFTVELEGLLKARSNFHRDFENSWGDKYFKYQIGDDKKSFIKTLEYNSKNDIAPWEWDTMIQKKSDASGIISRLTNSKTYQFSITGQVVDTIGTHVEIQWQIGDKEFPDPYKREPDADPERVNPPPADDPDLETAGQPLDIDLREVEEGDEEEEKTAA